MKVTLRALGYIFNITEYIDKPIAQTRTITGGFDTAQLVIPFIKHNELQGIDLSRRIPRMAIVEIEDIEDTRQYYVTNSQIERLNTTEYSHVLEMEELSTILQLRSIPDYSITQPIREDTVFVNEVSNASSSLLGFGTGVTQDEIKLSTTSITNDAAIIEDRVMKVSGDYRFNIDLTITTIETGRLLQDVTLVTKVNGVSVGRYNVGNINWTETPKLYSANINYKSLSGNETVELWLECNTGADTSGVVVNASIEIVYTETQTSNPIYLDYVVEKLLGMVNVIDAPEFTLDKTTKARLGNVLAFDDMRTDQTLYTAINRIVNYVKAKPRVELINNKKVLSFVYYSDLEQAPYVEPNNQPTNALAQIGDYVSGLEIKNDNVITDAYKTERVTLRTDGINQITTDNITIRVNSPIDKIKKVRITGIEMKDVDGVVVLNSSTFYDITDRVIEKPYYDVLDSMAYYDNKTVKSKNNHIYFERGSNEIKGLSYIGAQYVTWSENFHNRALYELIACELVADGYVMPESVDKGLTFDNNIIIEITYYQMTESNAVVLKDDQSGFEEKITRKLNANDRVNNAEILGAFVRNKVNAVGGTRTARNGYATDGSMITKVGSVNNGSRVVTVTKYSFENEIDFIVTEVKDHIFESEYIGIDSDRRLYRVDKTEWVDRADRALSIFELSKSQLISNASSFNEDYVVSVLANNYTPRPPIYAHLLFDIRRLTIGVDRNAIGNVIEWRIKAIDNFNMDYEKVRTTFNSEPFIYQRGVEYSNIFGNIENATIEYYSLRSQYFTKTHYDLYPRTNLPLEANVGTINYSIKKDARERFIFSNQLALLSSHEDIIVYNGFAKYNRMVAEKPYVIKLAWLDYEPSKDDRVIDLTRAIEVTNNTTVASDVINYIVFNAPTQGTYAWYEETTKEMLLVVKNTTQGLNRVYYGANVYSFMGYVPTIIYEAFEDIITLDTSVNATKSTEFEITFSDNINMITEVEDSNFVFVNLVLSDNTTLTSFSVETQSTIHQATFNDSIVLESYISFIIPTHLSETFNDTVGLTTSVTQTVYAPTHLSETFNDTVGLTTSVGAYTVKDMGVNIRESIR